ncbi:TPA: Dot/Icm T4SS effector Ceg9 [Legionella pneumophila]
MYKNILFFSNFSRMRWNEYDSNRYQSLWEHNKQDIKHTFFGTIANTKDLREVLFQPVTASFSMLVAGAFAQLLVPYSIFIFCMGDAGFAGSTLINYLEITTVALAMPFIALLSTVGRCIATVKCLVEDQYNLAEMVEDKDVKPNTIYLSCTEGNYTVRDENNNQIIRKYYKFQYKVRGLNDELCQGIFTFSDLVRAPEEDDFNGKLSSLTLYKYDILDLIKRVHKDKFEEREDENLSRLSV